jgi:hypothetical protein
MSRLNKSTYTFAMFVSLGFFRSFIGLLLQASSNGARSLGFQANPVKL